MLCTEQRKKQLARGSCSVGRRRRKRREITAGFRSISKSLMQVSFYEEKGKVNAISRGLDLGEAVCRGRESCLSRGSKGTALMVQLRSDQVKTVWFGHINRMVKCSHFSDFPTMIIFDPLRPKNCCPWVGNGVTSFTFGFGRKRSRPWCHLDLPILEIVHRLWFFPGLFQTWLSFLGNLKKLFQVFSTLLSGLRERDPVRVVERMIRHGEKLKRKRVISG